MEMKIKKSKKLDIRLLSGMRQVFYDKNWLKKQKDFEVYRVFRGIKEKDNLTYDITVIPPKMLGKEFIRTKGNLNSKGFQELYNVLEGEAILLMQRGEKNKIKDVFAVRAKKGDYVIIPPYYYVITINPLKKTLRIGNWVSRKTKNIYEILERMKGACYFYTKSGWIKNKNYKIVPKLRFKKSLKEMPKNLDFLKIITKKPR